jgi:hypothetical protein
MLAGEAHSPVTMTFLRPYGSPHDNGSQQVFCFCSSVRVALNAFAESLMSAEENVAAYADCDFYSSLS